MEKGRYKYFEELFADILLIWNNCKTYNVSGSDIYKLAETMERRSKKLIRDLKISLKIDVAPQTKLKEDGKLDLTSDDDEQKEAAVKPDDDDDFGYDPERYVPFDDKVEFADLLKRCTKEGLTAIVTYLQEKQPEALEDYGNDRLQIKVDMIERQAFDYCKDTLNHNLREAPNKRLKTGKTELV